jgi:hypothetical protein
LQRYGDDLARGVTASLTGSNLQQQDALAIAQNGGHTGSSAEDAEMADAEGDDGMDDDMMDKISSSPSIDDGGYPFPHLWPQRVDSIPRVRSPSFSQACGESSSPFVKAPDYYPLRPAFEAPGDKKRHHLPGEYLDQTRPDDNESDYEDCESDPSLLLHMGTPQIEIYDDDYDLDAFAIPGEYGAGSPEMQEFPGKYENDFEAEAEDEALMTIPYVSSDEDDDDYEFPHPVNARFIDSGWGGECLQESEDIDFEFVYALHTFVATVEGQANATKGDTMVLLDDSNSYWWLVRVVKDSSIGEFNWSAMEILIANAMSQVTYQQST